MWLVRRSALGCVGAGAITHAMADGGTVLGWGEALAYGIIQGLTEFLPVSSSGHLAIAHLLGLGSLPPDAELPFDVLLHLATLVVIVHAFRRELVAAVLRGPRWWGVWAIAVVPAGLAGLFGSDVVASVGDAWWLMGLTYLFTAALLFISEQYSARRQATQQPGTDACQEITWRQALSVGLLQIPALLPGVSRSGATVAGGLLAGIGPRCAVAFSFLAGAPLIAAAAAKDAADGGWSRLIAAVGWGPLAVAFLASLISGYGALVALQYVVRKRRLRWFALYCLAVAILCLSFEAGGV